MTGQEYFFQNECTQKGLAKKSKKNILKHEKVTFNEDKYNFSNLKLFALRKLDFKQQKIFHINVSF